MGLDTLQGHRDKAKLKLWYKLATMSGDRYPRRVFSQDWDAKPRRGMQRKVLERHRRRETALKAKCNTNN